MDCGNGAFAEWSSSSEDELPKTAKSVYITPKPIKSLRIKKKEPPQAALDKFWAKLQTKHAGKVTTILPKGEYTKIAIQNVPRGTIEEENALASYDDAVRVCKAKVENIIQECRRLNCKYSDPDFDIERDFDWGRPFDCLDKLVFHSKDKKLSPKSVKRISDIFEDPKFFISGPTPNDVRQGRLGNCWLMAALCAVGNKPDLIKKLCVIRDEIIGVYGFAFFRDGEWRAEVIDDKLYLKHPDFNRSKSGLPGNPERNKQRQITEEEGYRKMYQRNSESLYFAQCEDPNETWLPLLEKAYAKAHGDYASTHGGQIGEGIEDLTGAVATDIFSTDICDTEAFWSERLLKVNTDFLVTCDSNFKVDQAKNGLISNHAYSIHRAVEIQGHRLLLVRNPWGESEWNGPWSDGSKEWTPYLMTQLNHRFGDDGEFWIPYELFLQKFKTVQCLRLLNREWDATQQWISLNIPFVEDYHQTRFVLSLEKTSTVVIVLSQLNHRYFEGFQGRYRFALSFAVQKFGDSEYTLTCQPHIEMQRSVSADLSTLEAGKYHVFVKITTRRVNYPTVGEVVHSTVAYRRAKLVQVAFKYDLAHSRVREEAVLEQKRVKMRAERAKFNKLKKKAREKMQQEKKRKKHVDNKKKRKRRTVLKKTAAKAKAKIAKKAENEAKLYVIARVDASCQTSDTSAEATVEGSAPPVQSTTGNDSVINPNLPFSPAAVKAPATSAASSSFEADDAEDDDESELDSNVSNVSSGEVEDQVEQIKRQRALKKQKKKAQSPKELVKADDTFEPGYWNPVVVVGLRVYSKQSGVTIRAVRPYADEDRVKSKDSKRERKGEAGNGPKKRKTNIDSETAILQKLAQDALRLIDGEKTERVTDSESDGDNDGESEGEAETDGESDVESDEESDVESVE